MSYKRLFNPKVLVDEANAAIAKLPELVRRQTS
jgi:hypothetical protein